MTLGIGIANIRDNPDMPRRWVFGDGRTIKKNCSIALLQEINENEDKIDVQGGLGPNWDMVVEDSSTPIAYNKKHWHALTNEELEALITYGNAASLEALRGLGTHGHQTFHEGLAKTSPARGASWQIFRKRNRGRGRKLRYVAVICTHFVSGAWNNKRKTNKDWRQNRWGTHFIGLCILIRKFVDAGIAVFVGGDFNRKHVQKLHPKARWLINGGIDKLAFIPAATSVLGSLVRWRQTEVDVYELNSDHDLKVARGRLVAA